MAAVTNEVVVLGVAPDRCSSRSKPDAAEHGDGPDPLQGRGPVIRRAAWFWPLIEIRD